MDESAAEAPRRPQGDPTPERDEIIRERGIDPIGGMTPAKRNTALIFAGTAMVLGILWVNSGPSANNAGSLMGKPESMAKRPDLAARETIAYDAVAAKPQPLGALAADPNAPVINPPPGAQVVGPDGQIVPAMQPGAAPAGATQNTRQNLADQARRSTLIAYGGRDALQPSPGGSATASPDGGADGSADPAPRGTPNALDALRQSSAVGEARASMLPNRNYLVIAGTLIPCILQTAMNSAQPGYTSCLIPRDVYSENGRVVLMEKGTKVLGEYHGGIQQGQNRLFVLWTRAVTPQGVRIDLASPGSDALGRAGIAGSVDTFFWARFGSALLLSLVDDAAYIAGQSVSGGSNNFNNTTRTPSEGASIALQNSINIRPVLKKNQGEEVGIFVAKDFNFADVYNLGVAALRMSDTAVLRHYLAPILPLLEPVEVTELVINKPGEVGIEDHRGWHWHSVAELDSDWLATLAVAAASFTRQDVNAETPICSTISPGGERCQIVIPSVTPTGAPSFTVRKPSRVNLAIDQLAQTGLFTATRSAARGLSEVDAQLVAQRDAGDWPAFFKTAVAARKNILVSGATGSGKTTFAKALIQLIPPDERLLTIEDTRELVVEHRNVVHMVYSSERQGLAKVGPKQLLESALRMRPDRILLQELRDGTAFFYLRNVNSGHPGSITTVHAGSAMGAFEQLTLLVKESEGGRDLARDDIRGLLHMLVDVVVQTRKRAGKFEVEEVYFDPPVGRATAH